jgi:hypothetical protein
VLDGSGSFGDDVSGVGSAAPESLTHEA